MKVIAHRGDHTLFPSNTMAAFQAALDAGAYGFEFDVRISSDGVPIVFHNFTLKGTTGEGIVSEQSLADLQAVRLIGTDGQPSEHGIPMLDDVLTTFAGKLYLEVHVQPFVPEIIPIMATHLQRVKAYWPMMEVTSYEPAILLGIQARCPGLATDLLAPRAEAWTTPKIVSRLTVEKGKLAQARAVHVHPSQLTQETVDYIRGHGFDIHAWDVNNMDTMARLLALSVEQFTSDDIHLFLADDH